MTASPCPPTRYISGEIASIVRVGPYRERTAVVLKYIEEWKYSDAGDPPAAKRIQQSECSSEEDEEDDTDAIHKELWPHAV